jgi:hypothetical protein
MRLDHGGPMVLACCGSACELTLAGPSPIMGDGGTNYLVCCGGMAPAAQRGESMPESSPELRFGDACWLLKDAERKLRRRPLRSLCAGNCEAFDAVGCHPRVAVVHERRHRSTRIFDSEVSLPSLLAPIGRLRVLHLSSRRACRPRATVCARSGQEVSPLRGRGSGVWQVLEILPRGTRSTLGLIGCPSAGALHGSSLDARVVPSRKATFNEELRSREVIA